MGKRLADRSYPLARLGNELSAVINRVRQAFGPISMRQVAERFEVQEAEQAVNGAARQLQSGECDWSAWTQVLQDYEDVWMVLLDELRGARTKRHAA